MFSMIRVAAFTALSLVALPVSAIGQQSPVGLMAIEKNPDVRAGFLPLGLADRLRDVCPEINARHFRAWLAVINLRSAVRDMGYTDQDLRDMKANLTAKAAFKAEITDTLRAKGAGPDDVAGHCRIAQAEIKSDSAVGRLLSVAE